MARKSTATRSAIDTQEAPAAIGPYSQGILVNDVLYCSGQIAIDPETSSMVTESVEEETERVMENLRGVLRAASMSFDDVVRCTVYLTDINDYAQVNEVYARYFDETPPARNAMEVGALPRNARVEISCVAAR